MGKGYSVNSSDYKLLEEVGYGASATVYRAIYLPFNEVVAVKCLDLDRCNCNLDDIRREAQTMSLIDHPNAIRAFCSFVVEHNLWVVMPFMAEGSCLHLMKIAYPDGFEEAAICSILKETLKALEYLHHHGHIHRDVKAGNVLLDANGEVKLADFGVSACMFDRGDRQRSRNTFVGTPCWMAPEVLQPGSGYNFKADIWSFGITALELAHGHAPFSKYPPMKVLLMTIQNAPPGLDYDRDKKFSKAFKELVSMCLVKDQTKRPTAERLLKHSFFKNARPPELTVKKLFTGLPPLWNRVKYLQLKDAAQLAMKKMPSAEEEAMSQSEYQRGVSAWNFDVEDIKFQASMLQDDDEVEEVKEENQIIEAIVSDNKDSARWGFDFGKSGSSNGKSCSEERNSKEFPPTESVSNKGKSPEDNVVEPMYERKIEEENNVPKPEVISSTLDKDVVQVKIKTPTGKVRQAQSGPLIPGALLSHSTTERSRFFERCEIEGQSLSEKSQLEIRRAPSFSGPLMLPKIASANSLSAPIKSSLGYRDSLDDKSKTNLVQIKGRFSVTSENLDLVKGSPLKKSASVGNWIIDSKQMPISQSPREIGNGKTSATQLIPHLQNLFEQTLIQQDLITNLLNSLYPSEMADAPSNGKYTPLPRTSENNCIVEPTASERERLLLGKISELQARMTSLTHELTTEKLKYVQLQQRIDYVSGRTAVDDSTEDA